MAEERALQFMYVFQNRLEAIRLQAATHVREISRRRRLLHLTSRLAGHRRRLRNPARLRAAPQYRLSFQPRHPHRPQLRGLSPAADAPPRSRGQEIRVLRSRHRRTRASDHRQEHSRDIGHRRDPRPLRLRPRRSRRFPVAAVSGSQQPAEAGLTAATPPLSTPTANWSTRALSSPCPFSRSWSSNSTSRPWRWPRSTTSSGLLFPIDPGMPNTLYVGLRYLGVARLKGLPSQELAEAAVWTELPPDAAAIPFERPLIDCLRRLVVDRAPDHGVAATPARAHEIEDSLLVITYVLEDGTRKWLFGEYRDTDDVLLHACRCRSRPPSSTPANRWRCGCSEIASISPRCTRGCGGNRRASWFRSPPCAAVPAISRVSSPPPIAHSDRGRGAARRAERAEGQTGRRKACSGAAPEHTVVPFITRALLVGEKFGIRNSKFRIPNSEFRNSKLILRAPPRGSCG